MQACGAGLAAQQEAKCRHAVAANLPDTGALMPEKELQTSLLLLVEGPFWTPPQRSP